MFNADVGHAFNFHKCIRASAAVAGVVADFEVVKVLARAVAENDVFGMALRVAPEDRGPERRKSAPLERDVADAPVGGVALRFNREVAFAEEGEAGTVDGPFARDRHVLDLVAENQVPAAPFLDVVPEVLPPLATTGEAPSTPLSRNSGVPSHVRTSGADTPDTVTSARERVRT